MEQRFNTERGSYDQFIAAALPDLGRFAVALTGNPHDGMDLLQDGLMRLARAWHRVDVDGDAQAYARTILVRLNINRVRSRSRELHLARRVSSSRQSVEDRPYLGLEPWLEEALMTLSARQRTAIALVYLCDLSPEAAADQMSCRLNTLKTHLERAIRHLRVAALPEGDRHDATAHN